MSLESHKKSIETQEERESKYLDEIQFSAPEEQVDSPIETIKYETSKSSKLGIGKLIIWIGVIAFLLLAALKNPSETEAKAEINSMITEKFVDIMKEQATDDNNTAWEPIGSGLAVLFAPTLIDNMVRTDISNYIFFSTFTSTVTFEEKKKTLVAGVIILGKVIPLETDLKNDDPTETE